MTPHLHNVTRRGSTSAHVRELQERSRIARLARTPRVEIRTGPRGTFIRPLGRATSTDTATGGARWA